VETHRLMAERWDFAMHSGDIGIDETDVVRGQQFLSAGVQRMLGMEPGEEERCRPHLGPRVADGAPESQGSRPGLRVDVPP
jgi:hypothetical protein